MLKLSKLNNNLFSELIKQFEYIFNDNKDDLIEIYSDSYFEYLSPVVTDKNSLAQPEYFYDDYMDVLSNFNFIDNSEGYIKVMIPSVDNFDFSGSLKVLKLIVNGIAGSYLELPQFDMDELKVSKLDDKTKRVLFDLPKFFSTNTPKKLRFYLLQKRGKLPKIIQAVLDKKLVEFPFSNTPPIDIFEAGNDYFLNNIDSWLHNTIETSIKNLKG